MSPSGSRPPLQRRSRGAICDALGRPERGRDRSSSTDLFTRDRIGNGAAYRLAAGVADRALDGGGRAVGAVEAEWRRQVERRLRHEARARASVRLRGVDQERVAQVDRAGRAGRRASGERRCRRSRRPPARAASSRVAGRRQQPRDVQVRADSDARRRVVLAHVREQEQHEQGASARRHVDAPVEEVRGPRCRSSRRCASRRRRDPRRTGSAPGTCPGSARGSQRP